MWFQLPAKIPGSSSGARNYRSLESELLFPVRQLNRAQIIPRDFKPASTTKSNGGFKSNRVHFETAAFRTSITLHSSLRSRSVLLPRSGQCDDKNANAFANLFSTMGLGRCSSDRSLEITRGRRIEEEFILRKGATTPEICGFKPNIVWMITQNYEFVEHSFQNGSLLLLKSPHFGQITALPSSCRVRQNGPFWNSFKWGNLKKM